jgi:hypothetical protein
MGSPQPARDIQFADLGQRARCQQKQERVLAAQDHHLHGLPALEILVAVDAAMLAFGDLAADRLAVIDLRPIGAEIEPAGIGILGHHAVGGADEARLVELVMARDRKFEHVDRIALQDILQNRPVLDETGRQQFEVLHAPVVALHDVHLAVLLEREAERERNAADRREVSVEGAEALGVARDVVEQDGGRSAAALFRQHVGEGAHLDVPMGAVDLEQLSHSADFVEPSAQPAIADLAFGNGLGDQGRHAALPLRNALEAPRNAILSSG